MTSSTTRSGSQLRAQLDAARPVVGDLDGEALGAQAHGERVGDRRLVLDDDDRRLRFPLHGAHAKPGRWARVGDRVEILCRRA